REAVLAKGLKAKGPQGDAARLLFSQLSDSAIEKAVGGALNMGRRLEPILADPAKAKANLYAELGVEAGEDAGRFARDLLDARLLSADDCARILELTPSDGRTVRPRLEDKLAR